MFFWRSTRGMEKPKLLQPNDYPAWKRYGRIAIAVLIVLLLVYGIYVVVTP